MDYLIYKRINELLEKNQQAVIATIVNATEGTPRKIGAKMLVESDGSIMGTIGGGGFEKQVMDEALKVCKTGKTLLLNKDLSPETGEVGAVCGGQVAIFLEPIIQNSNLYIFGAGHVGKAIAEMAQYLDFTLNIIDDRPEWLNNEKYPMPCRLWSGNMFKNAEEIPLDDKSCIIILTRSWKLDEGILKRLLRREYAYLGVIGSNKKIETHWENLSKEGFTQEEFDRIYAPIGIPIGAYSPHEIAVSILGEIIAVMKGKRESLPRWEKK